MRERPSPTGFTRSIYCAGRCEEYCLNPCCGDQKHPSFATLGRSVSSSAACLCLIRRAVWTGMLTLSGCSAPRIGRRQPSGLTFELEVLIIGCETTNL